ncbi:MAG: HIT domain-containing protein [Actinobacteria bacterium]|nr:HIT domain-containing protein [Actinomycetota bacterium]
MPKDRLWAPWRIQYVEANKEPSTGSGCIFCDKPGEDDDESNLIVHRGEHAYVILNGYPYNNGHVMVVPYRHVAEYHALEAAARDELGALTALSLEVLGGCYNPGGFNVGINQGAAAGAGIAAHLHQHIVPRWAGDTNFMPVVADTRVLPEGLAASYEKIRAAFDAHLRD